jgi:hypothetical protein
MRPALLAAAALAPAAATALKLQVPLYIYPTTDAWAPLVSAIEAHPTVPFQIIINPNSGPGDGAYPDDTYAAAIAQLRAYSNVELVGYVHVLWGERDASELTAEIDTYAGWAQYAGSAGSIAMDGIFFDEAPSADDDALVSYMGTLASHAREAIHPSPLSATPAVRCRRSNSTTPVAETTTIFNLGTAPQTTRYFDIGSQLVVMEWAYADYTDAKLSQSIPEGDNSNHQASSSVILHDFSGDSSALESYFSAALALGLQAASATADCCYNSLDAVGGSGGIEAVADAFANALGA